MVNLGVIGLGLIAHDRMIPGATASDRVRLTALADVDPAMVERAVKLTGVTNAYADYRDLLARDDVDLVYVATPNVMHAEQAIACAAAKKHVLCEKPLACNPVEGEAMVTAAREHGVILEVNYMTRFHRVLLEAKRIIQEGSLGSVHFVRSHFSYYKPGGHAEFRLAAEAQGGGPLADIGVYSLDMFRWVLGQEVSEVHGILGRTRPGWEVHNVAAVLLKLGNGVPAYLDATFDFRESGFEIVTDNGVLIARDCFAQVPYGTLELRGDRERGSDTQLLLSVGSEDAPHYDMYRRHLDHLAECIEQGARSAGNGIDGLQDLRVMEAVYQQEEVRVGA